MKAILTAAGLGKRSGLNGLIRKELLNVYDYRDGNLVLRPILDVLITKLVGIGIDEIAVVLDPSDTISRDYLKSTFPSLSIFYQKEKNGFGDAVLAARDFVGDEGFLLAAGDGMVLDIERLETDLKRLEGEKKWTLFVMEVGDPRRYGVAVVRDGKDLSEVTGVVEKPAIPPSNLALCAMYYLPPEIFNFVVYRDGKAELTDAIEGAIRAGVRFGALKIPRTSWVSVGVAEEYRLVLETTYRYSLKKVVPRSNSKA